LTSLNVVVAGGREKRGNKKTLKKRWVQMSSVNSTAPTGEKKKKNQKQE